VAFKDTLKIWIT